MGAETLRNQLIASIEQLEQPPRTLARVLGEIDLAKQVRQIADLRCGRLYSSDEYLSACDDFAAADDHLLALRAEARAIIEKQTGVSWALIEGANL